MMKPKSVNWNFPSPSWLWQPSKERRQTTFTSLRVLPSYRAGHGSNAGILYTAHWIHGLYYFRRIGSCALLSIHLTTQYIFTSYIEGYLCSPWRWWTVIIYAALTIWNIFLAATNPHKYNFMFRLALSVFLLLTSSFFCNSRCSLIWYMTSRHNWLIMMI